MRRSLVAAGEDEVRSQRRWVALALLGVLGVLWFLQRSARDENLSTPVASQDDAPSRTGPMLSGPKRAKDESPPSSEPAEIPTVPYDEVYDNEPGPDVYTTPFPDLRPTIQPVVTIRVRHPFGVVPRVHTGAARDAIGRWDLEAHDDIANEEVANEEFANEDAADDPWGPPGLFGSIRTDGLVFLGASAVEAWRNATLSIYIEGCAELTLERPRDPVPREIVVVAKPEEGLVAVQFTGRVQDEDGVPVAGVGVFLKSSSDESEPGESEPAARTAADGMFLLATVRPENAKSLTLVFVAPGFAPIERSVGAAGAQDLQIRLMRQVTEGSLTLTLLAPDGSPAAWARVLMQPEGEAFIDEQGLPREAGDDAHPMRAHRLRLARLLGGRALDSQGYEFGIDAYLEDLLADKDGRLLLPSLAPGRYRLRAVLPAQAGALTDDLTTYGETRLTASMETVVQVQPPPVATIVQLRLPAGRSVSGRIAVALNPQWRCDCTTHQHFVQPRGWPWAGLSAQSATFSTERRRYVPTGRFRLDGMPTNAFALFVWNSGHGHVRVAVPAGVAGSNTDLGDIRVAAARTFRGRLVTTAGDRPKNVMRLSVEVPGVSGAESVYSDGDGDIDIALPHEPPAGAALLVRDGPAGPVLLRRPWPFPMGDRARRVVLTIPADRR